MAMSGTITGTVYNYSGTAMNDHYTYSLSWSATRSGRTASIKMTCKVVAKGNYSTFSNYWNNTITAAGTAYKTDTDIDYNLGNGVYVSGNDGTTLTFTSKTISKDYDANGNLSFAVSAEMVNGLQSGYDNYTIKRGSLSGTISLDNIGSATVAVTGISLNKSTMSLVTNGTNTGSLTATISPDNATNKGVTWKSNNTGVVTVSNGTVTAVGNGSTIVVATASGDTSKTASCTVTVTTAVTGVSLNRTSANVSSGSSFSLTATVAPSNASNQGVSWSSNNTNVATVSNGTVTAKGNGSCIITVTTNDGSKTATCSVNVSTGVTGVTLNTGSMSLVTNGTNTGSLTATVLPATASNKAVTWESSDSNVATVSNGTVTAKGNGTCDIRVITNDGGHTAICKITVTTALKGVSLSSTSYTITKNVNSTFTLTPSFDPPTASNKGISWSSSDSTVASVSNGVVTGLKNGSATITVTSSEGGHKATCAVTVRTAVTGVTLSIGSINLAVGDAYRLMATVQPSDASNTTVSWSSSDGTKATVSGGLVTGVAAGSATITVTTAEGSKTANCYVTTFNNKGPQGSYSPATYHNDNYYWVNEATKYGLTIDGTFIYDIEVGSTPMYKFEVAGTKVWFKSQSKQGALTGNNSLSRNGSYASDTSGGCATFDHCPKVFTNDRGNPISPRVMNITYNLKFYAAVTCTCYLKVFGYNQAENSWCEIPISGNSNAISLNNSDSKSGQLNVTFNTSNFYTNFKFGLFTPQTNGHFVETCTTGFPAFVTYHIDRSLES